MKGYAIVFAALTVLLICGITASAQSSKEPAEAQALFKQHCAMCHGQDGRGETPVAKKLNVPDLLSSAVQNKSDAELTAFIDNGKMPVMPAFQGKLKPEQIKDLVGYIRELAKTETAGHK